LLCYGLEMSSTFAFTLIGIIFRRKLTNKETEPSPICIKAKVRKLASDRW
jgi:hypothetical protein